jgi:hypothetical protein
MMTRAEHREKINYIQNSINVSARIARGLLSQHEDFCSFCKDLSDENVYFRFRKRLLYDREDIPVDKKDMIWESMMGDR